MKHEGRGMNHQPVVSFLFSSLLGKKPFTPDRLNSRLPLSQSGLAEPEQSSWTYGEYFQTIHEVLAEDSYRLLLEAVRRQLAVPVPYSSLQKILVYAEKHGNWYHPAKIEVITRQGCARFVLNAALTERGRAVMFQEIRALNRLSEKYDYPYLPTLYFQAESRKVSSLQSLGGRSLSLFLAEWFGGFQEFHLSIDPVDGRQKLILWDGSPSPKYLSGLQAKQVYFKISKMLTLYYDHENYEQIFPWHHGAGDFVIKIKGDRIKVRLVTVRQYGALADPQEMAVEEALLFFFLNLSIRMRLDRLDGVGEIVWAGNECLNMTWEGFLEALSIKEKEGVLSPGFQKNFLKDLHRISVASLTERFFALLESYDPAAPDLPVIKNHIISHINRVHGAIQDPGK